MVWAGEMCVVMETSGQGWFEWKISHLQHVSKLPLPPRPRQSPSLWCTEEDAGPVVPFGTTLLEAARKNLITI